MSDSETSVVVLPEVRNGVVGVTATETKTIAPRENDKHDPYRYQLGFGNYVATEAVYVQSALSLTPMLILSKTGCTATTGTQRAAKMPLRPLLRAAEWVTVRIPPRQSPACLDVPNSAIGSPCSPETNATNSRCRILLPAL